MWPRLILSLLLIHCLAASPAPGRSTDAWSEDNACANKTSTEVIKNQNDSKCVSFVVCLVEKEGLTRAVVKNCTSGQYYNATLGFCSVTKPDGCA